MSAALIWAPFESEAAAAEVAGQLLDEGLIACANLLPGVRSLYVWQGERGEARECGALFKTEASLLERAVARLSQLHPYDTRRRLSGGGPMPPGPRPQGGWASWSNPRYYFTSPQTRGNP